MHCDVLLGLTGRVAIVTGAASGYGRACAELLAQFGVRVVLCDINEAALREVARGLARPSEHMLAVRDISRVAECEQLVSTAIDHYQRLDILVNVAAVLQTAMIEDVDETLWQSTLDTNLKSQFFLARAACRHMQRAKWGRIINFVSTAGITGGTLPVSVYGISKAGVIAMTRSFARAYGRDNILVNAISPATLRTPLFRRGLSDAELEPMTQSYLQSCVLGRWTRPEEVARSVVFLASEMSSCVTGHLLRADSGAEIAHP
jgi:NAD(P)-dependent dehydrogenase (short-subunit alcohol dehydrogenase family)